MVRSSLLWLLGWYLTSLNASLFGEQLFSVSIRGDDGSFNVLDGTPYLIRKGEGGPPGNAVDIQRGTLVHYGTGKKLTYPLDGESPVISLGDGKGGSTWEVSTRESRKGEPVRAKEGKFKGWYLDWSEEEKELKLGDVTYHVRQLILVKEPKEIRHFRSYPVAK